MKWDVGDEGRFIDSSEESISDLDFLSVISDFEKHQDEEAFLKDSLDPFYQTPHPPPHWSYSPYSQGTLDYWDNSGEGIDHRLSYHGMYHGSFDGYNEKETYSDSPSSSPETIVKSKKRRKNKSPVEDALKIIKKESQHNLELPKKLFYKHNNSDNPFPKKTRSTSKGAHKGGKERRRNEWMQMIERDKE
ncbi:unnamed protein product [Lepeophtheirus salmonis]|uniref:(salmon louse) hypothetical protein n=1 Tax=Lepeophtheirus salmonis TaxID=72036 RepID=A0A7R8CMM0_LEPSM|nr:unnamed protein product [Lepeophtheirus salmonis]CAF2864340.1 unnamed protein product [Lepeophtheirus salmonis]